MRSRVYQRIIKKCKRLNLKIEGYNVPVTETNFECEELRAYRKTGLTQMGRYGHPKLPEYKTEIRFPNELERDMFITEYNDGYMRMVRGEETV